MRIRTPYPTPTTHGSSDGATVIIDDVVAEP